MQVYNVHVVSTGEANIQLFLTMSHFAVFGLLTHCGASQGRIWGGGGGGGAKGAVPPPPPLSFLS